MPTLLGWISSQWWIGEVWCQGDTPLRRKLLAHSSNDLLTFYFLSRRALVVLKDLIGEHKGLIEPTYYPANRFELSFYRNQVIHLFVSESMLCAALYVVCTLCRCCSAS